MTDCLCLLFGMNLDGSHLAQVDRQLVPTGPLVRIDPGPVRVDCGYLFEVVQQLFVGEVNGVMRSSDVEDRKPEHCSSPRDLDAAIRPLSPAPPRRSTPESIAGG